ncbi:MAG: DNA polymerase IV, partial [Chitinophagaceae bacterium]|nr:DNA polymerase IV [Chitinophagaceae bacterium]
MLTYNRHIANLDMDQFFVSVERLRDAKLKGKPILIGANGDRSIVAACSHEATKFGIYASMPMRVALRLCKYATIVKADYEEYSKQSKLIYEVIKDSVPLVEKAALDDFYIDLSGMDKFFGCSKFTTELKKKLYKESGLASSYGLASNKMVSKVAAGQVTPNGQMEIPFGKEKTFLGPLSVVKIPGVGKETAFKLIKMGVETIKVLSDIPPERLCDVVGAFGNELWRRANGIDNSPVIPYQEQKAISTEHSFQPDTIDMNVLDAELVRMTESIAFELRKQGRLTGCVVIKLRYTDGETYTAQRSIAFCNTDHQLIVVARELFRKLFTRRLLVRLIGIRFTHLIPGTYQINLFEDSQETIKLYQSID